MDNEVETSKGNKIIISNQNLGKGGFGSVFLGQYRNKNNAKKVAVKKVVISATNEEEKEKRLISIKREQQYLSKLEKNKNPHLLYELDFGTRGTDTFYFVMPLYEWTLQKFIHIDSSDPAMKPFIFKNEKNNQHYIK